MKVYAFVGKSGTGKSYQAANLCRELNIEAIVDDGLLIYKNDVLAGVSAKVQPTKIGAVKTALFTDENHKKDVTEKIKEINPESILVIGTSVEMVERIRKRIELPEVIKTINIEDVTTEKDREEALRQRNELGKHVVPAPTFALKRNFSGYLVDPLKIFRTWGRNRGGYAEKSVVRPTYSYRGDYILSDRVIEDISANVMGKVDGVSKLIRTDIRKFSDGITILVAITADPKVNIMESSKKLQEGIYAAVEYMTAFNVISVDVEIRGVG